MPNLILYQIAPSRRLASSVFRYKTESQSFFHHLRVMRQSSSPCARVTTSQSLKRFRRRQTAFNIKSNWNSTNNYYTSDPLSELKYPFRNHKGTVKPHIKRNSATACRKMKVKCVLMFFTSRLQTTARQSVKFLALPRLLHIPVNGPGGRMETTRFKGWKPSQTKKKKRRFIYKKFPYSKMTIFIYFFTNNGAPQ